MIKHKLCIICALPVQRKAVPGLKRVCGGKSVQNDFLISSGTKDQALCQTLKRIHLKGETVKCSLELCTQVVTTLSTSVFTTEKIKVASLGLDWIISPLKYILFHPQGEVQSFMMPELFSKKFWREFPSQTMFGPGADYFFFKSVHTLCRISSPELCMA